jgi:hypothetical protein
MLPEGTSMALHSTAGLALASLKISIYFFI